MRSSRKRGESVVRLLRQSFEAPEQSGGTDSCLDAETVAAMMDGGLPASALNAARLHAADCARCQSLVSALARLDPAEPAAEDTHAARLWLARVVPLTAAAAGIAIWVAVFPRHAAAPVPEATEAQRQATEPSAEQPATRVDRPATAAKANSTEQPQRTAAADDVSKSKQDVTSELRRGDANGSAVDRLNKDAGSPIAAASSARDKPAAAAPATAAAPSQPSANVLEPARAFGRRAESVNIDVVSPVPMVRWRLAGSTVQRSTDGGAKWETQSTGTEAELTAGAAPSAVVCWVVGRGGVVLLSIDGRSWRRLAFPEMTDLSAVRARDARAASVSTADGRTFSTTDAGATWAPRPLQDF
jgi:hypothetical protein